ncbi:MAG: hypothetical protein UR23_C0059G0010 [Candidatus Roizmanbacteria bacterium GW2011_GWA2_32_13]|uniref:Uncharacterized protein n=1 Tax=Candidatus Roizmanbacteria bacterium GW2011_GWA2_32_13 TaxID=1618475 RepID=A0A0F9YMI0_9BACT|nr:MAG: hypothetical protein UR23_C0059G0010 [Candidatus Roizmanbacteria bacterium GW2011_GWA2_32_13]
MIPKEQFWQFNSTILITTAVMIMMGTLLYIAYKLSKK